MKTKINRSDPFIALFFALASAVLVIVITRSIQHETQEAGTYSRFTTCALSIPATARTQDEIELCWKRVQDDSGITVKRYDK